MKEKLLVLLAGQSNMAGRGYLTEEDIVEIPGVTALRRDLKWIPAADPFNYDRINMLGLSNAADPFEVQGIYLAGNRRCGVGPGRTFGKLLKERFPDCEVGLIPAAVGGTPVASWMPGGKDTDPKSGFMPYDDAIKMTRYAMKEGRLIAILWHQGETDAHLQTPDYKEKLHTVIANFRRDLDARNAYKNGKPADLTAKEFDVVEFLMRNPNRVYSREALLDTIWAYEYRSDIRTVDVHIRRLREKLEENPAEPKYILTKWGVGYYFKK